MNQSDCDSRSLKLDCNIPCGSTNRPASSSRASSSTIRKKTQRYTFPGKQRLLAYAANFGLRFFWMGHSCTRDQYQQIIRYESCNQMFFCKMKKAELFKYCSVENLKREIKIQRKLDHPHIIKLDCYFEDKNNVYLVLEYAEGGSLFKQIKKQRRLTEDEAHHYLHQTCLGIEYLHKQKIIHRDIKVHLISNKPENLLLDSKGNIKICDFGWSTEMGNLKKAFCGTVEYMAPEMIKSQSTNYKLDIWCLGVLLYEMVQGKPPFTGRNDQEKCNAILSNQQLKYDEWVSDDCKSLIAMILQQNPLNRPSITQIYNHRWMKQRNKSIDFITQPRSSSLLMDAPISPLPSFKSPPKSSKTVVSERKTTSKEWEEMKQRSQRFVFHQEEPQEQQQSFFRRVLISLGCINR